MIQIVGQIDRPDGDEFLKIWRTLVDPATRMWQDHRHGNFEIAMVISGRGQYQTVRGNMPIEPGDVFVFPGNEPHWIREICEGGLEIINLHFNHSVFERFCPLSRKYPNLYFSHSDRFGTRIPSEEAATIRYYVESACRELRAQDAEFESYVYSFVNLIFCELLRCHGYYQPNEGTHTSMERIRPSLEYIDRHYTEDITLEQIAEKSGLSPCYFTRLFSQCFPMRLWDYVLSRRIDAAKKLLSDEKDLTVLEIALNCGFHNTANFNRIFLRFNGITPTAYRKGGHLH